MNVDSKLSFVFVIVSAVSHYKSSSWRRIYSR